MSSYGGSGRRSYDSDDDRGRLRKAVTKQYSWPVVLVAWAAFWVVMAILWAIGWLFAGFFWANYREQYTRGTYLDIQRWFLPHGIFDVFHGTGLFYLIVIVAVAITAFAATTTDKNPKREDYVIWVLAALLIVPSFVQGWRALWDNDKDLGMAYANSTVYVTPNTTNPPSSLVQLLKKAEGPRSSDDTCTKHGKHDVPTCIQQGDIAQDWERRTATATGADYYMSTLATGSGTQFLDNTITYTYDTANGNAWTGVRDGKDKQPLDGIVRWDGKGLPTVCRFTGPYSIKYAFDGNWNHSLTDLLAGRYPQLMFQSSDVWGYCRDAEVNGKMTPLVEPVIIIPVTRQTGFNNRTFPVPAGILEVRGAPDGEPNIQWIRDVEAGQFPGPVYPLSVAAAQRQSLEWSAGRGSMNNFGFGFVPANGDGSENTSEFQLRQQGATATSWDTPLAPANSKSKTVVGAATIRSDSVHDGQLNQQTVLIYPDGDPRVVNLANLTKRVQNLVRLRDSAFFSGNNPGTIDEINPVDGKTWQYVMGRGGIPLYIVVISVDPTKTAEVTDLNNEQPIGGPAPTHTVDCNRAPKDMSTDDVRTCVQRLIDNLAGRVPAAAQ